MTTKIPAAIAETARDGSSSVFAYIERGADEGPDGVRWRTLSYENAYYHDASPFNGTGGIALFLADYFRITGNRRALELALGAARWCMADDRTFLGDRGPALDGSLWFGRAGLGMVWLLLAEITGDADLLANARVLGDRAAAAGLGPVTDYIGGTAGSGVFLVRLWEATHDERYLAAADRAGAWLEAHSTRDAAGCHWPMDLSGRPEVLYLGFAHGIAGIGYFLLLLQQATGDARWADLARGVAGRLSQHAMPDRGGSNWPYFLGRDDGPLLCQWCHGAPGIGLFYTKAHEVLGGPSFLATAGAAGETTYAAGDTRGNPCQCHGLAGNAELLVELYRIMGEVRWLERAHEFARMAMAYRTRGPDGDTWQADEAGYDSPDYMCGAAGTGHFFLRLLDPQRVRLPLM